MVSGVKALCFYETSRARRIRCCSGFSGSCFTTVSSFDCFMRYVLAKTLTSLPGYSWTIVVKHPKYHLKYCRQYQLHKVESGNLFVYTEVPPGLLKGIWPHILQFSNDTFTTLQSYKLKTKLYDRYAVSTQMWFFIYLHCCPSWHRRDRNPAQWVHLELHVLRLDRLLLMVVIVTDLRLRHHDLRARYLQ